MALHGNLDRAENPGEILQAIEQAQHAAHAPARREDAQLPIPIRAVVAFIHETPARQRDAQELLRLLLRHLYVQCADYMPRQPRDDGRFRASAILSVLEDAAREYLSDADFDRLRR